MFALRGLVFATLLALIASSSGRAAECVGKPDALGTSRTLVVEPAEHIRLGMMQYPETLPLDDKEIAKRALQRIEARGRGMLLLHDIKPATVLALPMILSELKSRGYRIVHVEPATAERPQTATLPSQWLVPTKAMPQQAGKHARNED